ncbi:MAG: class I SAM-dependent methyltransferase [Polyangiaceae bacterium]|nr:class I SAM-dependent methyltransferase [Polyangiaceae bacterium]
MKAAPAKQKKQRELNSTTLKVALIPRIGRKTDATGEISFPCVPEMVDSYVKSLTTIFSAMGRVFSDTEVTNLKTILDKNLKKGFAQSPYARIVIKYNTEPPPHPGIAYKVSINALTIGDEYERWVQTREPPLFGTHPDAKVTRLAAELGPPAETPILDVGAGTGRNTLPMARKGYPTDAVEIAPALAEVLRKAVAAEKLKVEVFEGDALDPSLPIPKERYKLIVLAEVVASHFREVDEVRRLAQRSLELLAPGGILLFSVFVAMDGYKPDALAREISQVSWCPIFTRHELDKAFEGLPFDRVADECVHDYEHEFLPPDAWPPTGWFVNWSLGSDLFALPAGRAPIEMRWLSYRKK